MKTPCKGCPFRRDTPPGALGGSPVETYLGQARGPFWLPCHSSKHYSGENRRDPNHEQCAGAAIYRSNTGYAAKLPEKLLKLPEDKEKVFASPEELLAHHEGLSVEEARVCLLFATPEQLCAVEMLKQGAQRVKIA